MPGNKQWLEKDDEQIYIPSAESHYNQCSEYLIINYCRPY